MEGVRRQLDRQMFCTQDPGFSCLFGMLGKVRDQAGSCSPTPCTVKGTHSPLSHSCMHAHTEWSLLHAQNMLKIKTPLGSLARLAWRRLLPGPKEVIGIFLSTSERARRTKHWCNCFCPPFSWIFLSSQCCQMATTEVEPTTIPGSLFH